MTTIEIKYGDSVKMMIGMRDETIHLVVTSPPYDKLRDYGNHPWDFENTARQLYRVLVPGGIVCWNVNDSVVNGCETLTTCKQKIFFVEQAGFRVHDTMIWEKTHVGTPDSSRYHQMFEYIFILSKGAPRVFNPIKDRKNIWAGLNPAFGKNTKRKPNGEMRTLTSRNICLEFGLRKNVWQGNSRAQEEPCKKLPHHAMMPRWLAKDLIRSFSNEGDTVLDPFAGSGTVGFMARDMNRNSVMIDKDRHAIQLMRNKKKMLQPELV
jgi:site-specific DNA-methyltransferase (adenine-specific)